MGQLPAHLELKNQRQRPHGPADAEGLRLEGHTPAELTITQAIITKIFYQSIKQQTKTTITILRFWFILSTYYYSFKQQCGIALNNIIIVR